MAGVTVAQQPTMTWDPRTGDDWIDARLQEINIYARRYPGAFADEMARYHRASRPLVQELISERGMAAGDLYFACALAQAIGRPCRQVADAWAAHQADGWSAFAEQLGIKSGSDAYVQVKRGIVPTFDRWNRPITLDRALKQDFATSKSRPYRWVPPKPQPQRGKPPPQAITK